MRLPAALLAALALLGLTALAWPALAAAGTCAFRWTPPPDGAPVVGYHLYVSDTEPVPRLVPHLAVARAWLPDAAQPQVLVRCEAGQHWVVTTVGTSGLESGPSNTVTVTAPGAPLDFGPVAPAP